MARTDPAKSPEQAGQAAPKSAKRSYMKQSDVPEFSLEEALRIPSAIAQQFGGDPTSPADVAIALDLLPQGRHFKQLSGAAVAYRLVEGGAQAAEIPLSDLGRRITMPMEEGDDVAARREAFLQPRVIHEFLSKYNGHSLPTDERVACNVLASLGVPRDRAAGVFEMIVADARSLGLISTVKDRQVVNVRPNPRLRVVQAPADDAQPGVAEPEAAEPDDPVPADEGGNEQQPPAPPTIAPVPDRNRRVFVSHGSNTKIVDQLKGLLEFGEFEPVISVERETTSKPVPDKVMDDMRGCSAGIIHVGVEKVLIDQNGEEHRELNRNVLIEIGAAMALFGRNFILLVEDGTQLPSNLQGLYQVRYEGKTLDADATMKLLKAFKDFKS